MTVATTKCTRREPWRQPKGSGGKSLAERVLNAALKVALRGLTKGIGAVGSDGRVVVDEKGPAVMKRREPRC